MTPLARQTIVISLVTFMALPAWGQRYLLYSPQPAPAGQKTPSQDGILVQEIEIRKGDTLHALSRKFSGRGMYYPQILLFNSIKNPNLIYAGTTLRIPVTQKPADVSKRIESQPTGASPKPPVTGDKKTPAKAEADPSARQSTDPSSGSRPSTELSLSDLKTGGPAKNRVSRNKKKTAVHTKKGLPHHSPPSVSATTPQPPEVHESAAAVVHAVDASAGQQLFETAVKAYRQDDCRTALELLDRYLADYSASPLAADANLYKAECYLKLSAQ